MIFRLAVSRRRTRIDSHVSRKDAKAQRGGTVFSFSRTVGYVQRSPVQQHIKHMIHQAPFIACEGFKQRTAEHTRAPMSHAKEQRREGGERFFV
jgi:hypothetical protein